MFTCCVYASFKCMIMPFICLHIKHLFNAQHKNTRRSTRKYFTYVFLFYSHMTTDGKRFVWRMS